MNKELKKQIEEVQQASQKVLEELGKYNTFNTRAVDEKTTLEESFELIELVSELLAAGYIQYDIGQAFLLKHPFTKQWGFSKRADFLPLCNCNHKSFIHIEIFRMDHEGTHYSMEMNIRGEMQDAEWCDLQFYGIPLQKLAKNLESFESRLIKAWQAVNEGVTPQERYPEDPDEFETKTLIEETDET